MMYNQKLAAAIKVNGKVLREFKDTVYVPFASEYTVLIKNLNTVRALVNVYVDGQNVVPNGLVVNAGQSIDLERSIKNGNLTEGNRFKFIERTDDIENHRGIGLEDGIVRVEYQFERPFNNYWGVTTEYWGNTPISGGWGGGVLRNSNTGYSTSAVTTSATSVSLNNMSVSTTATSVNNAGITVPGSKSTQSFSTTSMGILELEKHSIIFKLLGQTEANQEVFAPVTVKSKPKCVTCGKQNKASAKFCSACGTALEIFA